MNLVELDFVDDVLVRRPVFLFPHSILRLLFDLNFSILSHNILHIEFEEAVEGLYLLAY